MTDTTTLPIVTLDVDTELPWAETLHRRERALLLLAGLFITTNRIQLLILRHESIFGLWQAAVWIICAVVVHLVLNRRLPNRDPLLLPAAMLLSGWGLVIIQRLMPYFATRQTLWLIIALAALLLLSALPHHLRWLSRYRYLWLASSLMLLIMTFWFGANPSGFGPRLWLGFANIYFQPSELLKLIIVIFMASYLSDHHALIDVHSVRIRNIRLPEAGFIMPLLLITLLCMLLLLWQRDLGTATLIFLVVAMMLHAASGRRLYLVMALVLLVLAGFIAYMAFDVVKLRVDIWINPWPEANDRAYQIVQSLLGFSAGGVLGQGIGQGSPAYVPVVHSDFAFTAIAEEWGLLGTLAVIACLAVIVVRGLRLTLLLRGRMFRSLLAAGLAIMLGIQSLMIMGGVLKLIPLTGLTLPFLSYGGSALLVNYLSIGLLLILSADAQQVLS